MAAKNDAATNPTTDATDTKTIRVRVNVVVTVDPAKWVTPVAEGAEDAPQLDQDAIVKALVAAGMTEDQATAVATKATAPDVDANSPSAVRTAVRDYVFAQVRALPAITDAGATISDRQ